MATRISVSKETKLGLGSVVVFIVSHAYSRRLFFDVVRFSFSPVSQINHKTFLGTK